MEITDLNPDPLAQFSAWYDEACQSGQAEPDAMTLATATADGRPSARTVLYKGLHENAILFFTNYESRKGIELTANPYAALVFYWPSIKKQVRIEGKVTRASHSVSENYFHTRGRTSQWGAWASPQSRMITDRNVLDENYTRYQQQFSDQTIPLPPFWGGFLVQPNRIEFWIAGAHRLHDRFCFQKSAAGWDILRLAP